MDIATRRALIDAYRRGPEEVRAAVAGATGVELDARPAPGEWTAREVVHHLADSETMSTIRLAGNVELLERLDESDWSRQGTHTESGPYSVETWLSIYAAHAHDHADQIRRARATAGPAVHARL
jgi:hypothetical protein